MFGCCLGFFKRDNLVEWHKTNGNPFCKNSKKKTKKIVFFWNDINIIAILKMTGDFRKFLKYVHKIEPTNQLLCKTYTINGQYNHNMAKCLHLNSMCLFELDQLSEC